MFANHPLAMIHDREMQTTTLVRDAARHRCAREVVPDGANREAAPEKQPVELRLSNVRTVSRLRRLLPTPV